jgi:hypothetical protein
MIMSPLRRFFRARQAEWRITVCLIPLFSLGCAAYYGAYGGPEPNPEVNAALAHELEIRDVKLALDFDCSAWRGGPGGAPGDFVDCINAVAIIRSTMQALDILWYPDPEASPALKPRYTVHLVLKEKLSLSWNLMNLVSAATLATVPHNQMMTREIGAVVSEPRRAHQNPAALERARREFGQIDLSRWLLAGDAVSFDQSIVASTTSTHRVRYWTSLFLPTAWMGGRGHRRVIVFGPIFYQPKAREPFEVVSREILLELIRQLPSSAADENTTSDSSAEDVQNVP